MDEYQQRAFNEGYEACSKGKTLDDNPYEPSGHERDTTFEDELHFQWYSGFNEADIDIAE